MIEARRALASVPAAALLLLSFRPLAGAAAPPSRAEALGSGAAFVTARQAPGGAFFDADAPPDGVAEAVASLVAAGVDGSHGSIGRAMDYVGRAGRERARTPAYAGRVAMGAVAAGRDPRRLGGVNYVARIEAGYNAATGAYENGLYAHALAVLGLIAAGAPVPEGALRYLRLNECSGGGFGHDPGCVGHADVDTTALAVCALTGARATVGDATRSWLAASRNARGGYGLQAGDATNANSTGLALSAMACLGQRDDAAPAAELLRLAHSSGGFRYIGSQSDPNNYATVQALPGVAAAPYPIRPGGSRIRPARAPGPGAAAGRQPANASALPSVQPCPSPAPRAAAGGMRRAGLVVQFASGSVREFCIAFSAEEERRGITGVDLLRRSGLPVLLGGTRSAASICRIGDDGCDGDGAQCFCECADPRAASCRFWGYYSAGGAGEWTFMQIGASARRVRAGDVDGWRYANHSTGQTPPSVTARPCATGRAPVVAGARMERGAGRGSSNGGALAAAAAVGGAFAAATVLALRRRRRAEPFA